MTTFTIGFHKGYGNDYFSISYNGNMPVNSKNKELLNAYLTNTYGMFFQLSSIEEKVKSFIKRAEELKEDGDSISENIYFDIEETKKIRNKLSTISYFDELTPYDQDRIEDFVEKAIKYNSASFDIGIELGRSPIDDKRIYSLSNMAEYSSKIGEYLVTDFI